MVMSRYIALCLVDSQEVKNLEEKDNNTTMAEW
jgi:hypothetical protein